MNEKYLKDIEAVLARRYDNGADYWATPDRRLIKGSPFTTLDSVCLLAELGLSRDDPVMQGAIDLIFSTWREDGRFRLTPQGAIYPCQTINAARTLSLLGYGQDPRLQKTFGHLLSIQQADGGWRCNKFFFGRGPETAFSNPGPTLTALDAFRLSGWPTADEALGRIVTFLLGHWDTRLPLGPCHYGIGTLFMKVGYPFAGYNIFYYVYVLSFFERARQDPRFQVAWQALAAQLADGEVVPARLSPKLASLEFCAKGRPSELGTARYREILENMRRS